MKITSYKQILICGTFAMTAMLTACSDSSNDSNAVTAPEAESNLLIDPRDGQTYKTATIGTQTWMAENLNLRYIQPTSSLDSSSVCLNDSTEYCDKYGRLYLWSAAMDSIGMYSSDGLGCGSVTACSPKYPVQGICPDGWHIPSRDEYKILIEYVGGDSIASIKLKSQNGWSEKIEATDDYGFSVLPSSTLFSDGSYGEESYAYLWTSTTFSHGQAYAYNFRKNGQLVSIDFLEDSFYSIRCIKNSEQNNNPLSSETEIPSSSSTTIIPPCKTENEDKCTYGELTDERDGKTYKTVTIGTQTWMAENLRYHVSGACSIDYDYCREYGIYYTWADAMDSVGKFSESGKGCGNSVICTPSYPVRGICPEGWHIPTSEEFTTLFNAAGSLSTSNYALKTATEWENNGNGADAYGFSVRPAGRYIPKLFNEKAHFDGVGTQSNIWTSSIVTNYSSTTTATAILFKANNNTEVIYGYGYRYDGYSIRCIKDE